MKKLLKGSKKRIINKGNKKGQFFLITAVVVIMVLFTLTIRYNTISTSLDLTDYNELRDVYNSEVPKVLNRAIFITTDPSKCTGAHPDPNCPSQAINDFQTQFKTYSSQKDPNFGLISIYRDPYTDNIIVKNLLASSSGQESYIQIKTNDYKGDLKLTNLFSGNDVAKGSVNLNIGGQEFSTTTNAPLNYYGENLTTANVGKVQKLEIWTSEGHVPIDLTSQTSTISTSKGTIPGNVDYDICPSIIPGNRCT